MTRVYIGGKRVTKEELANYEITNENAKRIIAQALARVNKSNAVHSK